MKKLGYLCSEFPALSHTFISREITILEKEGFQISTVSVNPTKNLDKMGADDKNRAAGTYYLKSTPKDQVLLQIFLYFLWLPRFLGTLAYAWGLTWFKGPGSFPKSCGYFIQAILLHAWAKKNGITHIHVHFANPAATVALLATRFGNLDFSLSVHGPDEFYDVERNNLREKIAGAVFVRCIGYFCRSQLMRLSPLSQWSKFHIVRCGIYKDEFHTRLPHLNPTRKLLCVGRICPSKGQAILLSTAETLRARGFDFHITFLGGGEDLETLIQAVADKNLGDLVTVSGPVGHSRVITELNNADLFVLPSFAEGIPVALMEAMAAGVPVISTDITGIPELIEHGKDGFLTQASNHEQLADVIELFLRDEINLGDITRSAGRKVRDLYDVEKNTKVLGELFNGLNGGIAPGKTPAGTEA